MKKTEFDDFWERSIYPTIIRCQSEADQEYVNGASLYLKEAEQYRKELKSIYIRKRNWLKKEYLPNDDIQRLDFHKLSAIICRCLIGVKPFMFDVNSAMRFLIESKKESFIQRVGKSTIKYQIDNIYINYKVAFYASASIAFDDLKYWTLLQIYALKNSGRNDLIAAYKELFVRLTNIKEFSEYPVSSCHDSFCDSMITSFVKTDLLKRDFDYLSFAAIMYQWQQYTKINLLTQILKDYKINVSLDDLLCSHESENQMQLFSKEKPNLFET